MLKENLTLSESGVKNETEISFFKLEDYLEYKQPQCMKTLLFKRSKTLVYGHTDIRQAYSSNIY